MGHFFRLSLIENPTPRQNLCTFLCGIWVVRLGGFLGWRIVARGWDWRFAKLMDGVAYNMFCFVCQGTWIFLRVACISGAHSVDGLSDRGPLDMLDALAAVITITGLTIEH